MADDLSPEGLDVEDLDAIKERADAAMEGPWEWDGYRVPTLYGRMGSSEYPYTSEVIDASHYGECGCRSACTLEVTVSPADAEFIAHARADVDRLLTEVLRLRAEVARYRSIGWAAIVPGGGLHHPTWGTLLWTSDAQVDAERCEGYARDCAREKDLHAVEAFVRDGDS